MEETNTSETKWKEEPGAPQSPHKPAVAHHRWQYIAAIGGGTLFLLSLVTLVFFLMRPPYASSSGTPPTSNAQHAVVAQTTPTPADTLPQQPLPCTVNLHNWTDGTPGWQVSHNDLLNTGTASWNASSGPTIIAPCDVSSAAAWASTNIAVQTTIRVTGAQADACFGLALRGTLAFGGWQGYKIGVGNCLGTPNGLRLTGPDYIHDTQAKEAAFQPGSSLHTYRVEIEDTAIRLYIDGKLMLTTTDTRYLTGPEIGLWSQHTQLTVTSFNVTGIDDDND